MPIPESYAPTGLPIFGGFNRVKPPEFDAERTINWFDVRDERCPTGGYLREFSGIKSVVKTLLGTHGRKMFAYRDNLFVVVGARVYLLDAALTYSQIGELPTTTGYVGIEANQRTPYPHILFVDGVEGWIWDGSSFTQVTDSDFPPQPIDVAYQDTRFFVASGESNFVGISDNNDGFAWQSLNRLALQTNPDSKMKGVWSANRKIYLMGDSCLEMWYPKGGTSPPYARDNTFGPDIGVAAVGGIAKAAIESKGEPVQTAIFFIAQDKDGSPSVMKLIGSTLIKVSTKALEDELRTYTNIEDARAYTYQEGGQLFYQFSVTQDNHTWVYSTDTDTWFEKEMLNHDRYIAEDYALFSKKQYVVGYSNGYLYEIKSDSITNDGEPIRHFRRMPLLIDEAHRRIKVGKIEVQMERGVATLEEPNPTIRLRVSKDGGKTYGNTMTRSLGGIGDYSHKTIFRGVAGYGVATDLMFEIETTSRIHANLFASTVYWRVLPR